MVYVGEKKREYQRNWLAARRQKAIEYLGGECYECGSVDNLEFDHIDPSLKRKDIKSLLSGKWEKLKIELDKCQLLCKDCHKQKNFDESSLGIERRRNRKKLFMYNLRQMRGYN
jgi:5-methylcytosine-specific restriction endonuclease McrA